MSTKIQPNRREKPMADHLLRQKSRNSLTQLTANVKAPENIRPSKGKLDISFLIPIDYFRHELEQTIKTRELVEKKKKPKKAESQLSQVLPRKKG